MTAITVQDGKIVMRDGKVGTEQACCCGGCVCTGECVEGLQLSLGNQPTCAGGFYFDFIECRSGVIVASMHCSEGRWVIGVTACCAEIDGVCAFDYAAELQSESDCLPPAGNVDLVEIGRFDGGGCPPLPPTVTIIK